MIEIVVKIVRKKRMFVKIRKSFGRVYWSFYFRRRIFVDREIWAALLAVDYWKDRPY